MCLGQRDRSSLSSWQSSSWKKMTSQARSAWDGSSLAPQNRNVKKYFGPYSVRIYNWLRAGEIQLISLESLTVYITTSTRRVGPFTVRASQRWLGARMI